MNPDVNPILKDLLDKQLEEHVFSRDALKKHPELCDIVRDTAWKYLSILEEFARTERDRSAIDEAIVQKRAKVATEEDATIEELQKMRLAVQLKGEQRLRATAHMSALNEEVKERMMQHHAAIDDYRKSLIGILSQGQRRYNDELLYEDSAEGRGEAAERLVGSMVRCALNVMRDEYRELPVPEGFDPKNTHAALLEQQKTIRRAMERYFGPTPDHRTR